MSVRVPSQADLVRDELLAGLLEQLSAEASQGRLPDVEAVAGQHPELADELRQLWATVQFAQQFARPRSNLAPTLSYEPQPATSGSQRPLPRTFGDYDLLEKLGQGGMGIVYKAWQRSLKRTVALKMILRGDLATAGDQARFRVEAEAAAHLEHPNIVAVYDAGECEGQAYFSMRYVEGQTLGALLASGPLRPQEAARLLAAISRAVDWAHHKGILHRDLKPSNVLIDANGQPHVTDFGLAKRVRSEGVQSEGLTHSGAIVGTPTYMAPEQVSGSRGTPSPVSDVYSLGVILYEMLTGRPPFQAPTPVDTLLLVLDQDPVRPCMLNPKVDPDLELICLNCLQKEPDLRYRSAAALADDLEAYLQGNTLSVRSSGLLGLVALFNRALRETHHAVVLENWGLLWMWHSVTVLCMCILTNVMHEYLPDNTNPLWYLLLWGGGLMVWGSIFWSLRKRGGPVLFVERQVAHVWSAAVLATISVFVVEMLLPLPVLFLSPMLAVIAGVTFMVKAGMLSGSFYVSAACLYLTAVPMALFPRFGPIMFGVVSALCFFIPGLKYHRQRLRSLRAQQESADNQPTVLQTR